MNRFLLSLFFLLFFIFFLASSVYAQTASSSGSEYTASAPCVQIPVGNPAVSPSPPPGCNLGSGASNYALKLVKAITTRTNCVLADPSNPPTFPIGNVFSYGLPADDTNYGGSQYFRRVPAGNGCLDAITTADTTTFGLTNWDTVKNDVKYLSDRPGGYLQCVGFANAVLEGAYNVALTPEHDAQDYAQYASEYPDYLWYDNHTTDLSQLKSGDAVIFSGNTFGHIAIAVKVVPGTVFVAEGNGRGHGEVDIFPYSTGVNEGSKNGGLTLIGWFHKK